VTEQELRILVRDAIARHAAGARSTPRAEDGLMATPPPAIMRQHPSHGLFAVPAGADTDGPCVIEPAVACNHCGYCKSYGH
jgi:hypothetical protein